jgi:hypothetical protein
MPYKDCLETSKYLMKIMIELEEICTRIMVRYNISISQNARYLGGVRNDVKV